MHRPSLISIVFVILCGCAEWGAGKRTGEIEITKAAPTSLAQGSRHDTHSFVLRARGYNVGENSFRISDRFGTYSHLTGQELARTARNLEEDAFRALLQRTAAGEMEDPKTKELKQLHDKLTLLSEAASRTTNTPNHHIIRYLDLVNDLETETATLDELIDYFRRAQDEEKFPRFDYVFRIHGNTMLQNRDYTVHPEGRYIQLTSNCENLLNTLKRDIQQSFENAILMQPSDDNFETRKQLGDVRQYAEDAVEHYRSIMQIYFTISFVTVGKDARPPRKLFIAPTFLGGAELTMPEVSQELELEVTKLKVAVSALVDAGKRVLDKWAPDSRIRLELESASEQLERFTPRSISHKLLPPGPNQTPPNVTFVLKTLYLRALGDAKNPANAQANRMLVTCSVKDDNNFGDATYPLIFEKYYPVGTFVNRKDRVIFGPSPYKGHSFDIRFTVMQLGFWTQDSLSSAFTSAASAVGTVNPELSAITPVVSALFGSIIKNADFDRTEFDVSFTLPQPEGKDKPDIDTIVAETGHYILIKREHPQRKLGGASSQREFYRNVVYNPQDGLLYRRVNVSDPAANFRPEFLFLDQSYAVIVVTDEYADGSDQLGAKLREQISRSLGEDRARKFVPSVQQTIETIQSFRALQGTTNSIPKLMPEALKSVVPKYKDELWQNASELRKGYIVDFFSTYSDSPTRSLLGFDTEKWKAAKLVVDANGLIHAVTGATETNSVVLPEQANSILQPFPVMADVDRFSLKDSHGRVGMKLPQIGEVSDAGVVKLNVPLDGSLTNGTFSVLRLRDGETVSEVKYAFVPGYYSVNQKAEQSGNGKIRVSVAERNNYTQFMLAIGTDAPVALAPADNFLEAPAPSNFSSQTRLTVLPTAFTGMWKNGYTNLFKSGEVMMPH